MTRQGVTFQLLIFVITPLTFLVHEFGHWLTGELLGYSMQFSLNLVTPLAGQQPTPGELLMISIAGPAMTILQGLLAWWMIRRGGGLPWYAVLYVATFHRFAAAFVSLFHPNDEARISQMLSLGTWTLPVLVVAGLLALTVSANRRLRVGWKQNLVAYFVASFAVAAVVFGNSLLLDMPFLPG